MRPGVMSAGEAAQVSRRNNIAARQFVLDNAIDVIQPIYQNTVTPSNQSVLNIPPQNVGLIKGFIVQVTGTLQNTGASQATRSEFGAYNAVSNFQFTDLQNQLRINTSGYHIGMLDAAKNGFGYGGAIAQNLPADFGNNWTVQSMASTIAATSGEAAVSVFYYIPIAYNAEDLRGAIYAGVVQATMNLQITLNTTPGYTTGDQLNAMAGGANTAVAWKTGGVTVNVWQVFLDQLPTVNRQVVLPVDDISQYMAIYNSAMGTPVQSQDFAIPYTNLRQFLSTFLIYDNGGTYNVGSDINYFLIQTANQYNMLRTSPALQALTARQAIMSDFPKGVYYFDTRKRPINTVTFGNTALVMNPSTVNSNASVICCYEAFARLNNVNLAGVLPTAA